MSGNKVFRKVLTATVLLTTLISFGQLKAETQGVEWSFDWLQITNSDSWSMATDANGRPIAMGNFGRFDSTAQPVSIDIDMGDAWYNVGIDLLDAVEHFPHIKWGLEDFVVFETFPIQAIAQKGSRIYAGTSGLLIFSDDQGQTWDVVDTLRQFSKGDNESGSHSTCKGMKQLGFTSTGKNQIIGARRICDIIFSSGRTIVAYDEGVVYNDNLDKHIQDPVNTSYYWYGAPTKHENGNALYGSIVNDLFASGKTILAGSNNGVFESKDNGQTWTGIGPKNANAYSVYISAAGEYFYGSADGIYVLHEGVWEKLGEFNTVYTIEEFDRWLLVGTREGFFCLPADDNTWYFLNGDLPFVEVRNISIDGSTIYLGTESGLFSAYYYEKLVEATASNNNNNVAVKLNELMIK